VSKKVDGAWQSGLCRAWIKLRNPATIAVQRGRSEISNRQASYQAGRADDNATQISLVMMLDSQLQWLEPPFLHASPNSTMTFPHGSPTQRSSAGYVSKCGGRAIRARRSGERERRLM
jgi:hypothetical protein